MGVRTARRVCSRDSMLGDRSLGVDVMRGRRIEKEFGKRVGLCIGVYYGRGMG